MQGLTWTSCAGARGSAPPCDGTGSYTGGHDDRGGLKRNQSGRCPCAALLLGKGAMKTIADRLGDVVEEAAFPELYHRFHRHSWREMDVGQMVQLIAVHQNLHLV